MNFNKNLFIICIVLSSVLLFWKIVPSFAQTKEGSDSTHDVEESKKLFERAVLLFNAGDYEGALENFLKSYQKKPHPKIKFNIGMCLYNLSRYADAGNAFEEFLVKERGKSPEMMVKLAEEKINEISQKTGILKYTIIEEGLSIIVDSIKYAESPFSGKIYVLPGSHEIEVSSSDGRSWKTSVVVATSEVKEIIPQLSSIQGKKEEEIKKYEGKLQEGEVIKGEIEGRRGKIEEKPGIKDKKEKIGKSLFWLSLSLTVASGIGAVVSGAIAINKSNELDELDSDCQSNNCNNDPVRYDSYLKDRDDIYDVGEKSGKASTVLIATTGLFAVATLSSLIVWKSGRKKERKNAFSPESINLSYGNMNIVWNF